MRVRIDGDEGFGEWINIRVFAIDNLVFAFGRRIILKVFGPGSSP